MKEHRILLESKSLGFADFVSKGLSQETLDNMFHIWKKKLNKDHSDSPHLMESLVTCYDVLSKKLAPNQDDLSDTKMPAKESTDKSQTRSEEQRTSTQN